jgi:hypothetical protein
MHSQALVLFEPATGQPVFNSPVAPGVLCDDVRPPNPASVHPALKSVIERGWRADPAQRPTLAEITREQAAHDWVVFTAADRNVVRSINAKIPPDSTLLHAAAARAIPDGRGLILGMPGNGKSTFNNTFFGLPLEHADTRGAPPFTLNSFRNPFMNWRHRVRHCLRSTIWQVSCGVTEARVSVANTRLISKRCLGGILILGISNMVVNVLTKDHTISSRTHRIAATWLTRIREGRMSTSICFRTSNHGPAES